MDRSWNEFRELIVSWIWVSSASLLFSALRYSLEVQLTWYKSESCPRFYKSYFDSPTCKPSYEMGLLHSTAQGVYLFDLYPVFHLRSSERTSLSPKRVVSTTSNLPLERNQKANPKFFQEPEINQLKWALWRSFFRLQTIHLFPRYLVLSSFSANYCHIECWLQTCKSHGCISVKASRRQGPWC